MDTRMERVASTQEQAEYYRPRLRRRNWRVVLVALALAIPSVAVVATQLTPDPHVAVARQSRRMLDQELRHARRDLGLPDTMLATIESRERLVANGAGHWFYNYQSASAAYAGLLGQVRTVERNAPALLHSQAAYDVAALSHALASQSADQAAPYLGAFRAQLSDDSRALDVAHLPRDYVQLDVAVRQQSHILSAFWPAFAALQQFSALLQQALADGAPMADAAAQAQSEYAADVHALQDVPTVAGYHGLAARIASENAELVAAHTQALPALDTALLSTLQDRIKQIAQYGGDASGLQTFYQRDAAALQSNTSLTDLTALHSSLNTLISAANAPLIQAESAYDLRRANDAAQADSYFSAGGSLYRETYPAVSDPAFAYLWPYTQAMAGAIEIATAPGAAPDSGLVSSVEAWANGLANYWEPSRGAYNASVRPPLGVEANTYYDDNAWAGIDLARAYEVTHDPALLAQAKTIFAFETTGWANSAPCQGPAGGVYWLLLSTRYDWQRSTTATAGAADLAAWLYTVTGDTSYLQWAQRMSGWIQTYMRDPASGLYYDHMSPGGPGGSCVVDKTMVPYNQAVMIETDVLLYKGLTSAAAQSPTLAEQRQSYLQQAENTARAALQFFKGGYDGQSPPFVAIYFRALRQLYSVATDAPDLQQAMLDAMRTYSDWAWTSMRDGRTNVNQFPDEYGRPQLLNQGAMVSVMADLSACEAMSVTTQPSGSAGQTLRQGQQDRAG